MKSKANYFLVPGTALKHREGGRRGPRSRKTKGRRKYKRTWAPSKDQAWRTSRRSEMPACAHIMQRELQRRGIAKEARPAEDRPEGSGIE